MLLRRDHNDEDEDEDALALDVMVRAARHRMRFFAALRMTERRESVSTASRERLASLAPR
jgi:hypothetical protein